MVVLCEDFTARKRSLGQGNILHQFVILFTGEYLAGTPPGRYPPPGQVHPPGQVPPQEGTPPWASTTPRQVHPL